MPFPDRANWWLLTTVSSSWTLYEAPSIEPSDGGWDRVTAKYWKNFGTAEPTAALLKPKNIGDNIEGLNFWCSGSKPEHMEANIWMVSVYGVGISGTRPVKVRGRSSSETQQGEAVTTADWVGPKRAVVRESAPTVEIEYVQVGGSPPTGDVGLAGTPIVAPFVRSSVFTAIDDPLYHYPSGWVFDDVDWEAGPGGHAYLIKEMWSYIFQKSI